MPLADSNLAATWDAWYREPQPDGSFTGYTREAKPRIFGTDGENLRLSLGIVAGMKVALIGGGFGWLAEDWTALGVLCTVTDTSTWVQTNKGVQATLPVLNETCLTLQSRKNVLAAAGIPNNGRFAWAVTEDVLPVLTDNEGVQLSSGLRNFADNVGHWVTVNAVSPMNSKTLAAWKTLVNPDKVVQRGTGTVL